MVSELAAWCGCFLGGGLDKLLACLPEAYIESLLFPKKDRKGLPVICTGSRYNRRSNHKSSAVLFAGEGQKGAVSTQHRFP